MAKAGLVYDNDCYWCEFLEKESTPVELAAHRQKFHPPAGGPLNTVGVPDAVIEVVEDDEDDDELVPIR